MPPVQTDSRVLRAFAPALTLLAIFFFINYIDRGNLGIAAPLLKGELRLSDSQLGILLSAFFWTYTAMQFVSGWLVQRFDETLVIAAGFLVWSLATAVTGILSGFVALLVVRLVLGVGESVAFPASSKILAHHLPEHYRGFANGLVASAFRFGNLAGTLGAGLLMADYGWRPVFIGVGLLSLLWLPAWMHWKPRRLVDAHSDSGSPPPGFVRICFRKCFWGVCLGHFAANYQLYFMVTWLPSYLVRARNLNMQEMARTASFYYLLDGVFAFVSGWIADFAIRRGTSPTVARKSAMVIGHTLGAIGVLGCALAGQRSFLLWLAVAGAGSGLMGAGVFAFAQTLAGPRAVGKWAGLQNGFANLAGVIGPALTGIVIAHTGSFLAPFIITAAVLVVGSTGWLFMIQSLEPVRWSPDTKSAIAMASANS